MSQNYRAVKLETFLISSIMVFLLSHEASRIDLEKQLLFPSVIAADWLQLGWLLTEPNDTGCSVTKSLLLCLYPHSILSPWCSRDRRVGPGAAKHQIPILMVAGRHLHPSPRGDNGSHESP